MHVSFISRLYLNITLPLVFLCFTQMIIAHPSIGIVVDSKGNIYYSDLDHVWKISNGKKSIAVANVHTHELFLDQNDNLFGEHLRYAGDASKKFYHYYWRRDRYGKIDTIAAVTQAYVEVDFSLALDKHFNQYYCKFNDSCIYLDGAKLVSKL